MPVLHCKRKRSDRMQIIDDVEYLEVDEVAALISAQTDDGGRLQASEPAP